MKKIIMLLFFMSFSLSAQENYTLSWTGNHSGYVRAIAISPDGSRIFSGGDDKTIKAWNPVNGNLLWTGQHDGRVNYIDVSPDGKRVVTASSDKTVRMWDADYGGQLWIITDVDIVIAAIFSSFGNRVMIANEDNNVKCLNAANGNVVWIGIHDSNFNTGVNFLSVSANGNFAASGSDRFIKVWNITTQTQLMIASTNSNVSTVYFNNDWTKVISSDWSGNVKIWNAVTGSLLQTMVHSGRLFDAKYSPDGNTIASIGDDNNLKLWNAASGSLIWTGSHTDDVISVAFSPDGSRIASGGGSSESLIKIWNASNGSLVWTSPAGQAGQTVSRIIYSPDGNKILSANHQDNSIKYWTKTPTEVENVNNPVPSSFSLLQNYPNPFNPVTKIEYELAEAGFVSLKVFDLLGNEVATLVEEFMQPGKYTAHCTFNSNFSSGIYFYRLKAGNFIKTQKMVYLK